MESKRSTFKRECAGAVVNGLVALSLAFGANVGLLAGTALPALATISGDERLAKLEVKFFKHTYPKDDDGTRLERLEKMIFGEAKSGDDTDRLKNLASTVPNLNDLPADSDNGSGSPTNTAAAPSRPSTPNRPAGQSRASGGGAAKPSLDEDAPAANKVLAGESKYPAITALEQHLFQRDYAQDAVGDRLNRLETKVFGRPSRFTDLSERVDALKEKTSVDIAKQPPPGADWNDDDDDSGRAFPMPRRTEPVARADGDDGRSFSGRNVSQDLKKAFGIGAGGGGGGQASGAFGMSGTGAGRGFGNSASGAYGMGGGSSSGSGYVPSAADLAMAAPPSNIGRNRNKTAPAAPPTAPSRNSNSASSNDRMSGSSASEPSEDISRLPVTNNPIGLNQQVTKLESAVLGKTFDQDPLISRVGRLEKTVFPKDTDAAAKLALPERVARLVQKVPIADDRSTASASGSRRGSRGEGASGGAGSGASGGGGPRKRPSGWIDEDVNLGYGGGSSSSSSGGDDDSYSMGQPGMNGLSGMGGMSGGMSGSSVGIGGSGFNSAYAGSMGMGQQQQQPKGLGKIINKMGNALSGGFTGGYNINSSMTTDPSTGYLRDNMTGNLINPSTGAVVGRSAGFTGVPMGGIQMGGMPMGGIQMGGVPLGMGMGMGGVPMGMGIGLGGTQLGGIGMGGVPLGGAYGGMPYGSVYGGGMPMGGFNGFNNGFSPYGMGGVNPYGYGGTGIRFGGIGSGMRIGF